MSIVSSAHVVETTTQVDGRSYVRETHVDNVGITYVIDYLAAVGADYVAIRNARAVLLATQIADNEFLACVEAGTFTTQYQTAAQFAARFRAAYRTGTREQTSRLAYWLIERINAGQITDAQVQAAFGLTTAQYNAMKTRMTTLHDDWAAVLAAVGE